MDMNKQYKLKEFADLIGVSTRTLLNWDNSGVFKALNTPSGQKYYSRYSYLEYIAISDIPVRQIRYMGFSEEEFNFILHRRELYQMAKNEPDMDLDTLDLPAEDAEILADDLARIAYMKEHADAVHEAHANAVKKAKASRNSDTTAIFDE